MKSFTSRTLKAVDREFDIYIYIYIVITLQVDICFLFLTVILGAFGAHALKDTLDEVGVYEQEEVEEFNRQYFDGVEGNLLSALIDVPADRFNIELDWEKEEDKADFKIKAKQFVKVYGQMAAILPYEILAWEKLFWFLKFLIPKLVVKDPEASNIDELLESVDLSTYGLERTKLNEGIKLKEDEGELNPQNPAPRGAHGEKEEDILENIIKSFNERWFQGWEATPEEQRIKFLQISKQIKAHPDYETKVAQNSDQQNSDLALKRIMDEVMRKQRKNELDLYRLFAKDDSFYQAFFNSMKVMIEKSL